MFFFQITDNTISFKDINNTVKYIECQSKLHVLFSLKGFSEGEMPVTSTSVFWCSWQYFINLKTEKKRIEKKNTI